MPSKDKVDSTLLGVDSNKNFVRDDLELYIYKNITQDPRLYRAYLNYAQSLQLQLIYRDDIERLQKIAVTATDDRVCIFAIENNYNGDYVKRKEEFLEAIFNTKERIEESNKSELRIRPRENLLLDRSEDLKKCR